MHSCDRFLWCKWVTKFCCFYFLKHLTYLSILPYFSSSARSLGYPRALLGATLHTPISFLCAIMAGPVPILLRYSQWFPCIWKRVAIPSLDIWPPLLWMQACPPSSIPTLCTAHPQLQSHRYSCSFKTTCTLYLLAFFHAHPFPAMHVESLVKSCSDSVRG